MGRITSELRLFAADPYTGWVPTDKQQADLRAIADRIDAEHEAACAEAYGNGVESVALPDMTAYVKLPIDAEGEPIHVGDVMEWPDCSTAEVVGIGNDTFFYVEDGEDAAEWSCANDKIHHHAPTVEDVLTEMVAKVIERGELTNGAAQTIAEYAAKLTLRGDE